MQILVLGYIVRGPLGGLVWHHFQYVLGLKQMGHEVLFLEDSDDFAGCYNPDTFETTDNPKYGLAFIHDLFATYEMKSQWAYYDAHTGKWYGNTRKMVTDFCAKAEVVLNLSGVNPLRDWWTNIPCRILVDTDPAFTQIKHLSDEHAMNRAKAHTHFATYGENFGKEACKIPDDGFPWQPTRQPVCLNLWNMSPSKSDGNWTTVMQWDSYKTGEYKGALYGMKSLSFEPYISLPKYCLSEKLELALGSANAPKAALEKEGWKISNPLEVTRTPAVFQKYIESSKGEWSIAKHGYVITKSGWFSERTLNYMASGKPVVIQDTGFTDFIPTGNGVLVFSNMEEAIEQLIKAAKDYEYHCLQSRQIVAAYFEAEMVLQSLLSLV